MVEGEQTPNVTPAPNSVTPDTSPAERTRIRISKHKSTVAEYNKRIFTVKRWLAQGLTEGEIKVIAKDRWLIKWRQALRYVAHARQSLLAEQGTDKAEMRGRSLAFYQNILSDNTEREIVKTSTKKDGSKVVEIEKRPAVTLAQKMAAQEGMRKLLGLDAPIVVHNSVSGGMIVVQSPIDPEEVTGPAPAIRQGQN